MESSDTRTIVLKGLERLGISYEIYEHPPLPTIELALEYWKDIDSTHCKNLFFRNHKGNRHYLVVFECHHDMDIHDLEKRLRQGKLTFASERRMVEHLGLHPGSVSPFGLFNDPMFGDPAPEHAVKLFLDVNLKDSTRLSFHPNDNTASVVVSFEDFERYLRAWGGEYEWIELY